MLLAYEFANSHYRYMYRIIQKRKTFLIISGILCGLSLVALILWGLRFGIDFKGGTMMEVSYPAENQLSISIIREKLTPFNLGDANIQPTEGSGFLLRFKDIDETTHQAILSALGKVEETRYESFGPTIGAELSRKARWAVILAIIAILLYIAWAFRKLVKIGGKGESWRYGLGATFALIHDVLVIVGLFAIMGHFKGVEVNTTFITAILTVLGYSVNDTIVVYDRIRENLLIYGSGNLEETINQSLNETIVRSLNTTLTTLLALFAIYLFGGETIKDFILAMMVGIATGAWSSIAIASPFLLFKRK